MSPTSILRSEHLLIDRVLGALVTVASRMESGTPPPTAFLDGALDFIGAFVDDCHHAKEDLLFDVLEGRPDAPRGLLADLRAQHGEARRRIARLRATADLADDLRDYARYLRTHLSREQAELFPRVDATFGPDDVARLTAAWDALEARVAGPAARAALVELADTIAASSDARDRALVPRAPTAADVMRSDVPAVAPADSLARAADMMARLEIRELPVVEDGRLVGIVTQRDMEPHRGHLEWTPVSTAMTRDPVTVPPDAEPAAVASLLLSRAFNAVPVAAGGTLLGMLARADLLRLLVVP